MFKKILYPTDFSDCSENAIPYLRKMKGTGTKEVILLYVIDTRYIELVNTAAWLGESIQQVRSDVFNNIKKEAEKKMEMIKKRLSKDYKVRIKIEKGIPFKKIIDIAEKERVSIIVLGSHGKSNLREMLIGSVSEKVIRKSKKPCLVIKR